MTEKELDEQWTQQMQNQLVQCGLGEARLNEYPSQYDGLRQQLNAQRPLPVVSYALRLSDDDVERIAEAVVLRLKADYPR